MGGDVLVSVEHADGIAGVVRNGELACLSGYLEEGPRTVLDGYWSAMEGLTGERSAEGGFLPPDAGDENPPDEPPDTVPEVAGDWQATPWLRCRTCGYAEAEVSESIAVRVQDFLPDGENPT